VLGQNDNPSGVGIDGFSKNGIAVRGTASTGTALSAFSLSGMGLDVTSYGVSKPAVKISSSSSGLIAVASEIGLDGSGKKGGVQGFGMGPTSPTDPTAGAGVVGFGTAGYGLYGVTLRGGAGVLAVGLSQLGTLAGEFQGDVYVKGSLFKYASLFSIDHPLDPKRKLLNHAAVESNEYKTFYDGEMVLDRKGQGTVTLPPWFEALNADLRYQLTPLDHSAPELHIKRKFRGGTFVIAGGREILGLRISKDEIKQDQTRANVFKGVLAAIAEVAFLDLAVERPGKKVIDGAVSQIVAD
jgi:hypothetical protein